MLCMCVVCVCCSVWKCVAVHRSMLQCSGGSSCVGGVCCYVWECVAVCGSVL